MPNLRIVILSGLTIALTGCGLKLSQPSSTASSTDTTTNSSPTLATGTFTETQGTTATSTATSTSTPTATATVSSSVTNTNTNTSTSSVTSSASATMTGTATSTAGQTFMPLHTYYLSPTGSDSNSGTSPSSPWLSPNHPINCGDVILAAPGTYVSTNFGNSGNWGTVSNCPSTSGGIDGRGGVYFANLICDGSDIESCNAVGDSYTGSVFLVDRSNWAVTGFKATNSNNVWGSCFVAHPDGSVGLHHIAFINDWAEGCPGDGVGGYGNSSTSGIDYIATVGIIAHGNAGGTSECYSGLSIASPTNWDTAAGTHMFVAGVFSYENVDGTCGYNAGAPGGYTTASNTVSSGNQIKVASASGFAVGMPIVDLGTGVLPIAAIPKGTVIIGINGTTITLSQNLAGKVSSGDDIQAALTTDGEGIIFDTWNISPYSGQSVVEQNMTWHNGSAGYEFNQATVPDFNLYVFNNSSYGNLQDPYHYGYGGLNMADLILNNWSSPSNIYSNIFQESVATMGGAPNNTSLWIGDDVYVAIVGETSATSIHGNFFKGLQTTCVDGATCDSGDNVESYNGYVFGSNSYASAGFANPSGLPSGVPNCTGYATTTACMLAHGAGSALTPSGAASGIGYQPPQACRPDSYYPLWLKGVVGITASGNVLNYSNTNLITKPCNL